MTKRLELATRLEELSSLEPGWYANVGKRTGERCCVAMREAAAMLRQEPSVEEMARVIDPASYADAEEELEPTRELYGDTWPMLNPHRTYTEGIRDALTKAEALRKLWMSE